MNISGPITFTIYGSFGVFNLAVVVCISVLYLLALCVNVVLVLVVCAESRLHRPMYVLLVNLAVSGVMGSSAVCPSVIGHLLVSRRQSSLEACLTQVFFVNVYSTSIFWMLALMAYDRYVSICRPLLYHSIMTPTRVRVMLTVVHVVISSSSAVQVFLTSRLRLCRLRVDKLVCDSLVIANLSCQRTALINAFGLCCAVGLIFLPCFLVILSYVHIFAVVFRFSKVSQRKALETCSPHLITFISFSVASFFGLIYNRLSSKLPPEVNILTSITYFVFPPLLHPIVYGMKMTEIRHSAQNMVREKMTRL